MAQQGDLGLDPARAAEASEPLGAHDAVAGDEDRDRIAAAGPTHGLRWHAEVTSDLAVGAGVAEGNGRLRLA